MDHPKGSREALESEKEDDEKTLSTSTCSTDEPSSEND